LSNSSYYINPNISQTDKNQIINIQQILFKLIKKLKNNILEIPTTTASKTTTAANDNKNSKQQ
jgi:hypothetical protein